MKAISKLVVIVINWILFKFLVRSLSNLTNRLNHKYCLFHPYFFKNILEELSPERRKGFFKYWKKYLQMLNGNNLWF